jgi:hypothetical protein
LYKLKTSFLKRNGIQNKCRKEIRGCGKRERKKDRVAHVSRCYLELHLIVPT